MEWYAGMPKYQTCPTLFIPNLHTWYIIMTDQDSWHLLILLHYWEEYVSHSPLVSHTLIHSQWTMQPVQWCDSNQEWLPGFLTNWCNHWQSFRTQCNCHSCVFLAYIPFSRSTKHFHWSRLTLTDTSSRWHGKML